MTEPKPAVQTRPGLTDTAIELAAAGLELFPVNPQTKAPLVEKAPACATTDPAQIGEWFARHPDALIGCRVPAGCVILDIDVRHGGDQTWRNLTEHYPEPRITKLYTRLHRSGRGDNGGHFWFKLPENHDPAAKLNVRNLDRFKPDGQRNAGIDLLQRHHRFTILPPSPHPATGKPYYWEAGSTPTSPIAELPGYLYAELTREEPQAPTQAAKTAPYEHDRPGDLYEQRARWGDVLAPHGWTLVKGDGDTDGSLWRHPDATAAYSASIQNGCLFVHSDRTPFDTTQPGDPHGYTKFHAYTVINHGGDFTAAARTLAGPEPATNWPAIDATTAELPAPETDEFWLDWETAFAADQHEDWLYPNILARGRSHVFYAKHKVGKSLVALALAAELATSPEPVAVAYFDYEMSVEDVVSRLFNMGYEPPQLARLHYALFPMIAPLDTAQGSLELLARIDQVTALHPDHHWLIILDTTSRALQGEENSADTIRAYYRETGQKLKHRGYTVLRLDHAGKDASKGQRGTSAKGDDVDVIWKVERDRAPSDEDNGDGLLYDADAVIRLRREAARMSWVPELVGLVEHHDDEGNVRYRLDQAAATATPAGVAPCARRLDELGVPANAGRTTAREALRVDGYKVSNHVLEHAVKYRKSPK